MLLPRAGQVASKWPKAKLTAVAGSGDEATGIQMMHGVG